MFTVTKPDDSSLDPDQRRAVEERARRLLDRASAWGVFPTPIGDILAAAKLKVAPTSIFDLEGIAAYLKDKAADAAHQLKAAVGKIFGLTAEEGKEVVVGTSLAWIVAANTPWGTVAVVVTVLVRAVVVFCCKA